MPLKILSFEYILDGLLKWYEKTGKREEENDFSILKTLKLLFFVSAATSSVKKRSVLLEDIYDRYVAMPYGHVESDVYNYIRDSKGRLNYFIIDNRKTHRVPGVNIHNLENTIRPDVKVEIDHSLNFLQSCYPSLILLSPFDLVNLSHSWYSWKHYYHEVAQPQNQKSALIPALEIKKEEKIYRLQKI